MRIFALLSWFDEKPEHLRRCVRSLEGFADVLVAVDGAYSTFPGAVASSSSPQHWALNDAARTIGHYSLWSGRVWESEVAKRAAMFEYARDAGATADDWLIVIDADESLQQRFVPEVWDLTRAALGSTTCDVAEIRFERVQVDDVVCGVTKERRLYRALPGLTVERAHYLYTVPNGDLRRFLWRQPNGHLADESVLDLSSYITMQHRNSSREPDRRQRALDYYRERDAAGLEAVGDWR